MGNISPFPLHRQGRMIYLKRTDFFSEAACARLHMAQSYAKLLAAIELALMVLALTDIRPVSAETPAEAYAKGCGGCHTSERTTLRKITRVPTVQRRAWIEAFMSQHPCERDSLKPLIVEYLLERTTR